MIRIVRMTGKLYGMDVGDLDNLRHNVELQEDLMEFIDSGDPVLLVESLSDVEDFFEDPYIEVIMVEPE